MVLSDGGSQTLCNQSVSSIPREYLHIYSNKNLIILTYLSSIKSINFIVDNFSILGIKFIKHGVT
jgi:hypothetical protein